MTLEISMASVRPRAFELSMACHGCPRWEATLYQLCFCRVGMDFRLIVLHRDRTSPAAIQPAA